MPVEKKGFIGRKREGDVNNLEGGYKGKRVDFHNPQPELACEYHGGNPRHGIETCYAFKKRLLELIKMGWVSFEDKPNVNSNPLPKHAPNSSGIGMIEVGNQCKALKVSMKRLYDMLVQSGFLKTKVESHLEGYDYCEYHGRDGHHIEDCIEFCEKIAKMLKIGELRIEPMKSSGEVSMMEGQDEMTGVCRIQQTAKGPPRLILVKPSCTKGNHNAMHYNYGYASNVQTPLPLFQTEISGLTRSGRCFTPEELRKAKGKEVVDLDKALEVNKPVTEEESNEFLKLIKHSEYCIVDQLKKTPARISLMSLILSSEPHRNALQKVLNEAYVPQDIEHKTMEHLVGRIHATNYLYFTADELDAEGTGHNKPLYITVRCKDCLIGKVLIDNGSALNVLPKHMLEEMPIDESHIKPSTMMARAYDGSPRPIIGTLEVELYVGPQMFLVTLQVMDIHPSYSMLLGRPWIHAAGAVASSLHQCLKYIMNEMLVTVKAEETVSMTKNVAVPFIEAGDCKGNNIHAFEIVNTDWVPENTVLRRPKISEAARMASLCFLNREIPFQYNLIIGIPEGVNLVKMKSAAQRFGLGYQPNQEDYRWAAGRRRAESLDQELSNMSINTLGENKMEGDDMKTVARKGDEALPQLTVYTIEEVSAKTFVRKLVEQQEQTWKPIAEELETINVGSDQLKKELKIGTLITSEQRIKMITLLQEYSDVFAWSYEDMPGLDTNIVVHKIPLEEGCKPVKQKLRRAHPDVWIKVKAELEKQWDAGFLEVVRYPQWVSNVVVVPKKEGKIRVCVDFRNLNRASPKDDFPLPHIDVLVDNAARSSTYSFMDGFSGYNQIKMAPEDKAKTTFVTPWGTFCYKVMPFGLKNAGATYQRAMVTLFHDMMHKEIEVYVDDMIAKSKRGEDHVEVLRKLFERLRKYELRLNPAKCSFGVKSGKLLGFVVSDRGIEVDPDKVRAIQAMSSPKTEKEVRGFLGRLNYIARFIAQLTTTCEPIFRLLRKKNPGTWNEECEEAFNKIKHYLQNPPLLVPPVSGKPLVLYLTVTEAAMGCVLGQHDETGRKERAIYYLSKKFTECESRYTEIERLCCALVWAAKRLRHYMLYYTTWLISKVDPLRYICNKPFLSSRIARWQVLLAEYDIIYMTRKAVKGSAIADHLADNAVEDYEPLDFDFPDEDILSIEKEEEKTDWWTMFFDGAVNVYGNGAGAVIISPDKKQYPVSVKLHFECTNNTAEYEACILGLEAALELKIKKLDVYGDSMLIICQVKGEWQTKEEKLRPYQEYLSTLAKEFEGIRFTHLGREGNHFADALATLAAMTTIDLKCKVQPVHIDIRNDPAHCCLVEEEIDGHPWYYDIKNLVQNHEYPVGASKTDKKTLRRLAIDFYLDGEILYKRSFDGTLLRCLNEADARKALREVHEGICSTHASGHMIARKIQRAGYFWMTLEKDCIDYVRKCQVYSDKVNMPPAPLFNLISPWPFAMWGIDVIGPVNPKASNGHRFILVAIDYFTKWVEANSYAHVTQKVVKRFIEKDLICRYGPPEKIVTDNAQNFNGKMIVELCTKWKIKHSNSSPYRPKMNGAVEAANKNIKKIIQKMVVTYKDWHEMLPFALHAYRTTVRTSTGTTPYSLVYGMEAVMPLEVEIPSLRVLTDSELEEAEWAKVRYEQLNLISEKRIAAICHHQLYQKRMAKAYDKKVRPRLFREGDLVLKKILSLPGDDQSKWAPNYEGPYVVKKAFSGGALKLARMDGEDLARPVNFDSVKRYYA
ncbi:uncharacterized protein LOC112325327 [Populus trichocarpa]|uniref:uncharacterized protein LOC112325327 n=1 Tax=Populus trichocarpa TaxID=3694 RepID=UPI0022793A37|nr:uncharacterized protein LOC112325327 [Populus trichocarpa]